MNKKKKNKQFGPYNKTPLMIKEALGEEVYNMMEEATKDYIYNPNYTIYTSAKGIELLENALKQDYDKR